MKIDRLLPNRQGPLLAFRDGNVGTEATALTLGQGELNMPDNGPQGRRAAIPPTMFGQVFEWRDLGCGMRRIANLLGGMGITASKSSVFRLLHGLPPYQKRLET